MDSYYNQLSRARAGRIPNSEFKYICLHLTFDEPCGCLVYKYGFEG
jgi:hypothetical protein